MEVIEREITTTKSGQPVMVIKPAPKYDKIYIDENTGKPFHKRHMIMLDKDLWRYSETHNPEFLSFMTQKTLYLCTLFEIEPPKRKREFLRMMMSISDTITNGIDDLVDTPPIPNEESSIIKVKPVGLAGVHAGIIH